MIASENDGGIKSYGYEEAINLAGTGRYNLGLLATLILTYLAMYVDMLGFSTVVLHCACDFQLTLGQKSVLVSMPFVGPILTAYFWGYISDTRGRRMSLIIGMFGSFIISTLCAFSPNWITLAILKLIGTCFCSCAQSGTFALMGESCPQQTKGKYLQVLSSISHVSLPVYFSLSYLTGFLDFSYDLGLINFTPWRLLVLVMALPLALSGICLLFFYESPKFLLNAGQEDQDLEILRKIHRTNRGSVEVYPVYKLVLNEEGNIKTKDVPFLQSLREQTIPLFKPPLLFHTMLLFLLIAIMSGVGISLYTWLPFLANAFTSDANSDFSKGLCSLIEHNNSVGNTSVTNTCKGVGWPVVVASLLSGSVYSSLNALMAKLSSRKKALSVVIFSAAGFSCILTTLIPNWAAVLAYFGTLCISLGLGSIFVYFVELYPTSFRGMAACLGVMVSRTSSVAGVNIAGSFITTSCSNTFYVFAALYFGGAAASFLLPPDRSKKAFQ